MKHIILYLFVVVVVLGICALLTKAIVESDAPLWLKYFILK